MEPSRHTTMSATNQNPERIEVGADDAPEPPWVVAARRIDDQSRVPWVEEEDIIRAACEQHAAALAQERDLLRQQMLEANTRWEAAYSERETLRDKLARALSERDRAIAERDQALLALTRWEESRSKDTARLTTERNSWNASFHAANKERLALVEERDRLTAERDRYLIALECIVTIGEDTSPAPTPDWERIARAALAPTQKEEA